VIVKLKEIAERTSRRTCPIPLFHILSGENGILTELVKSKCLIALLLEELATLKS
jgi:hypothetical protein